MKELVDILPQIILYLVFGFVFLKTYQFTRIVKFSDDYENSLLRYLVIGFILKSVYSFIPISINSIIDNIIMIVISLCLGYGTAKFINNPISDKFRDKLGLRQTFGASIWDDLADEELDTFVTVFDDDGDKIIEGIWVLTETYERQPLIQLAAYTVSVGDKIVNDFSNEMRRTVLIDTSQYKDIRITYAKNSKKVKR